MISGRSLKTVVLAVVSLVLCLSATAAARKIPLPENYGRVVMDNYTQRGEFPPVVFDHWLHRANFTCRVCHVDIGFAMEANGTKITAEANRKGFYCGACHDGKRPFKDRKIFAACSEKGKVSDADKMRCDRCHSWRKNVKREYDYATFTKDFPKRIGYVDWETAEEKGIIKPADFLEGVSIKRAKLKPQKDFSIKSQGSWMADIIFSHEKHAVWNGCELCHPEIFPSVKKGQFRYTMFEIYRGEYCGLCHLNVAFHAIDCSRCHTKPVK